MNMMTAMASKDSKVARNRLGISMAPRVVSSAWVWDVSAPAHFGWRGTTCRGGSLVALLVLCLGGFGPSSALAQWHEDVVFVEAEGINYLQFVPVDPSIAGACVAAPGGLLAWLPGDGHLLDLAGANPGTLRNGATFTQGQVGEAFLLDGADDYVETALDVQPSARPTSTWEAWVFPTRSGGRQQILSADDGGYDRSVLVEGTHFGVFTGWGVWTPVTMSFNEWQHFAVVFSPTNIVFYKNGERYAYDGVPAGQDSRNALQIGRNPGFGEYFQGRIDEVAVYDRALSDAEVRSIAAAGRAGKCRTANPCPSLAIGPPLLSEVETLRPYRAALTVTGGSAPHAFVLASGTLPPGFSLSPDGVVSGTTEAPGTTSFQVRVTDALSCSTTANFTLTVRERAVVCWPVPAGLGSWWRAEGDALDAAGTNHAVLKNGAGFAAGKVGQGFALDGVDDYLEVSGSNLAVGTGDFTVEGWAKTTTTKDFATLFSFGPWEPALYVRANGTFSFYYGNNRGGGTNPRFNDGLFHHFAAVRQNGVLSLYQDGRVTGTLPFGDPVQRSPLMLGWDTYSGDQFPGVMDDVGFHRRGLSAEEVLELYAAGAAGKCVPDPNPPESQPVITGLRPSSGPPGAVVFITGSGFDAVKSSNEVEFNGTRAPVVSATSTELVVVAPTSLAPGQTAVIVRVNRTPSGPAQFTATRDQAVGLSISGTGKATVLGWPENDSGFELETTSHLGPAAAWTRWPGAPAVVDGRNQVQVTPVESERFFRLRSPNEVGGPSATASVGRGRVSAATGGVVVTEDQAISLVIPPHAMAQDTDIEVIAVQHPAGENQLPGGEVFLSPDGLTFSKPATLKVQVPGPPPAGHRFNVQLLSGLHPPLEVGGEVSYFQRITNYTFHPGSGQLEVPLNHFSAGLWSWSKDLYAVLDIPGRFLNKGDLLYVLTRATEGQGGDWMPGHCGLYLGNQSGFSGENDGNTVIESTQTRKAILGEVRFDKLSLGQTSFKSLGGTHIYMGARRPAHFDLTDNQRTDVAEWAISKIGQRYLIVGGGAFLANEASPIDGYTCVGFTELAYEFGAGRRIVPSQTARILFTPFRQFQWTVPVNTAEIKVGETFECLVYGVVNFGTPVSNDYYSDPKYYSRSLDLDQCDEDARAAWVAERASFEPTFGGLTFTPAAEDAGKDFKFAFVIDASQSRAGVERTEMIVQVTGRPAVTYVRQDPPVIRVETFQGTGSPTNLVVTDRQAYTRGPDGSALRLFWEAPPAHVAAGSTFHVTLQADAGSNPAEQVSSLTAPPRLLGDIEAFPGEFDPLVAFAGYEFSGNCNSPFGSSCYRLVTRPVSKSITVPAEAHDAIDFRGVTLEFRMFRSFGPFNPGEIRGRLEWVYLPQAGP